MALSKTITAFAASSCVAREMLPIWEGRPGALPAITSVDEPPDVVGVEGEVGVDGVDGVDGVADSDARLHRLQLLVECDEHARVDRERQVEQKVVVLADDKGLHVRRAQQHRQQARQRHIIEQEFLAV